MKKKKKEKKTNKVAIRDLKPRKSAGVKGGKLVDKATPLLTDHP